MATTDNQFFPASGEPEIPFIILIPKIAGIHPAMCVVAVEPQIFILAVDTVAGKNIGSGNNQYTAFPWRTIAQVSTLLIYGNGFHLLSGHPQANRPQAAFTCRRVNAADAGAFCQSVTLENFQSGALLETAEYFYRQRGGTTKSILQ